MCILITGVHGLIGSACVPRLHGRSIDTMFSRRAMIGIFIGALVIAGVFTFVPAASGTP